MFPCWLHKKKILYTIGLCILNKVVLFWYFFLLLIMVRLAMWKDSKLNLSILFLFRSKIHLMLKFIF